MGVTAYYARVGDATRMERRHTHPRIFRAALSYILSALLGVFVFFAGAVLWVHPDWLWTGLTWIVPIVATVAAAGGSFTRLGKKFSPRPYDHYEGRVVVRYGCEDDLKEKRSAAAPGKGRNDDNGAVLASR